jgi:hypothetical protein
MVVQKNFIPAADMQFDSWQLTFVAAVNNYKSGWGWTPTAEAEWTLLTNTPDKKKLAWDKAIAITRTHNAKPSEILAMNEARKDYEFGDKKNPADTSLRIFINRNIRFNPHVTLDQKREMGLTIPDETKTPTSDFKSKISGTELEGSAKNISHLLQKSTVHTPGQKSKAKGEGVDAIEIFLCVTELSVKVAPELKDFQMVGEVSRGTYTHTFPPESEGKRAWYYVRLRIKGKVKTYGPPSAAWSAIIC